MKTNLTLLSLIICNSIFAYNFDFSKLKVTKDIKPGLWKAEFTITPKHPQVQNRSEQICATPSDLVKALNSSMDQSQSNCKIEIKNDLSESANLLMICPPIVIPQLGIKGPGENIPMKVSKVSETQWTIVLNMPAVSGHFPKSIWKHTYTRISDCK